MTGPAVATQAGEFAVGLFDESLAPPTRFDLNFRIGDIPVRIHPLFWISAIFLGIDTNRKGIDVLIYLLAWAVILFVSILVHELGHILMGRYFGSRGHIVFTALCGLAIGSSDQPKRWQRIAVFLAGPGAGFLLAALVTGLFWLQNPSFALFLLGRLINVTVPIQFEDIPHELVGFSIYNLMWINTFWGLVNLLPIWPLDGGQICREICQHFRDREGMRLSLMISLGTAMGFALLAVIEKVRQKPPLPFLPFLTFGESLLAVLFFAILAVQSWQLLQFLKRAGPDWDAQEREPRAPWEQDADWWKRGDNPWRD